MEYGDRDGIEDGIRPREQLMLVPSKIYFIANELVARILVSTVEGRWLDGLIKREGWYTAPTASGDHSQSLLHVSFSIKDISSCDPITTFCLLLSKTRIVSIQF